ncbi:MAG: VOC family protein [Cryobacterium sp.]|nr:VOC family protein [Cryobacterium sp.]
MSLPDTTTTLGAVTNPLPREIASFGAVHLDVTDLRRSTAFWQDVIGLTVRTTGATTVDLGTATETLVTIHSGATASFQQRHSGLYHLAIHPPTEPDFARILLRLARAGWRLSPTDHVMSKAIYLLDPDGITVEITLETPERMRETVMSDGAMHVVHSDGTISSGRDPLDVQAVLATLHDDDTSVPVPVGTRVGHVHLYVGDLDAAYQFYAGLGFNPALYVPRFGIGDLGAGGAFNHRIAVNTWQGQGAPQTPEGTARMRHFTIRLDTGERLEAALPTLTKATETDVGYLTHDPSGNMILLAHPGA